MKRLITYNLTTTNKFPIFIFSTLLPLVLVYEHTYMGTIFTSNF